MCISPCCFRKKWWQPLPQELDELLRGTCAGDRLLVECPATEVRNRLEETEWWSQELGETVT